MLVKSNFGFCLKLIGANTALNEVNGEVAYADLPTLTSSNSIDLYITKAPPIPIDEGENKTAIDGTKHQFSVFRETFNVGIVPFGSISDLTYLKNLFSILNYNCVYLYAPKVSTTINGVSVRKFPAKLENGTDNAIRVVCTSQDVAEIEEAGAEMAFDVKLTFERKYL